MSHTKSKITPFLMFNKGTAEAIKFYTSVFKNSEIVRLNEGDNGAPATGEFILDGQRFIAYDGGDQFRFSEGISLFVYCEDQTEVDYYWERLTAEGGEESMCGWLKDKFGVSWQIVPKQFEEMMGDPDGEKVGRMIQAMLQMHKLDVAKLREAFEGK